MLLQQQKFWLARTRLSSACETVVQASESGQFMLRGFPDACADAEAGEALRLAKGTLTTGLAICANLDAVQEGVATQLADGLERAHGLRDKWWNLVDSIGQL